ncbi:MAG: hypothetical protein HOJ62_11345 [Planctomycetaceae bacterium]|nr:hypothetical protein [Planctomycetaceae bacterium]
MKIRLETHQVLPPGGFFYALREYALREYALREYALREYALREYALREYALREYVCQYLVLCRTFMVVSGSQANASSLQSSRKNKYPIQLMPFENEK